MEKILLLLALLPFAACDCTKAKHYAVGAKDSVSAPVKCTVADRASGVLAETR